MINGYEYGGGPYTVDCPAGYKNTDYDNCVIDKPQNAIKPADKICEMLKNDKGILAKAANDPDCDSTHAVGAGTANLSLTLPNERLEVSSDADGRVTITQKTYESSTNSTTTSISKTNTSRLATSSSSNITSGNTADSSSGSGSDSGSLDGTSFPNDYSKSGEAMEAENTINENLKQVRLDLLHPGDTSDIASQMPTDNPLSDIFSPLAAFRVPPVLGTCPFDKQFQLFNNTYSFHVACDLVEESFVVIRSAFTLLFTVAALFILLRA
jgi:hypothetical protein